MELQIVKELERLKKEYDEPIKLLPEEDRSIGQGPKSGSLEFSQKKVIRTTEFYSNDRYLISQRDELGREKPFMNIVNGLCDVEDAAKDFDSKDVQATADDGKFVESFLMTKWIYQWMKRVKLGKQINESKRLHTRYGGVLAKKCYKDIDGKKTIWIDFPAWKNLITDQVDIINSPKIEYQYLTKAQLAEKKDAWDADKIKQAIKEFKGKGRMTVYEVRGDFPQSTFDQIENGSTPDPEDIDYTHQYYVLAQVSPKKYIVLYHEDNAENIYKYLARKPKAGRALGIGVVEENDQPQVWTNDAVQKQQRAFEYSSKFVGQSASRKLKGRNMMTEVDDGQILEHEDGKPVTPVPLIPAGGMAQFDGMINQWYVQAQRTTSAFDAQRGEELPSGTPFRSQAMQLQQSSSVFKDLQQDLGMFWEEIFNDWIMPDLAKDINTSNILAHQFSPDELKEIDKSFAAFRANQKLVDKTLNWTIDQPNTTQEDYEKWMQEAVAEVAQTKDTRFLAIPKNYFKDIESRITINITGENKNKAAILESLFNIMTLYAQNPTLAQNSVLTKLFMEIVEQSGSGISPVSIMGAINEQAKQMQDQQQQQQQGVQPQSTNGMPVNPLANAQPAGLSLMAKGGGV